MDKPPAEVETLIRSCRIVLFETDQEHYELATCGGSLFLVSIDGVPYGITAAHNRHSFDWNRIYVTSSKSTGERVPAESLHFLAVDPATTAFSELRDVVIIRFRADVTTSDFDGCIPLTAEACKPAERSARLLAYGALSESSTLNDQTVAPQFAQLGFEDAGWNTEEPSLRSATASWLSGFPNSLAGLSGGPVYNLSAGGLAGMVVRGKVWPSGKAIMHFLNIAAIWPFLDTVHRLGSKADGLPIKYGVIK